MDSLCILGATGSIGQSTLAVVALHPQRYRVWALTGYSNMALLAQQIQQFSPEVAVVPTALAAQQLRDQLGSWPVTIDIGDAALCAVSQAQPVDCVMSAIVGAAGLLPTLAAVQAGKRLLLANKEAMVIAGELMTAAARRSGAQIIPVDSEHNAIFQCLPTGQCDESVDSLVLTASGGPLRQVPQAQLAHITPQQACAHPNWSMGAKISVDSATLMNKGLELIEASYLFALPSSRIEVVVHPQSIIHSLVRYCDGSLLAQMGQPDMRIAIAYALAYPQRIPSGAAQLDLTQLQHLTFEAPDDQRFPCLALARGALQQGGTATAVLNAANEVAVAAFLQQRLRFTQIAQLNEALLNQIESQPVEAIEQVLQVDQHTRQQAQAWIARYAQETTL